MRNLVEGRRRRLRRMSGVPMDKRKGRDTMWGRGDIGVQCGEWTPCCKEKMSVVAKKRREGEMECMGWGERRVPDTNIAKKSKAWIKCSLVELVGAVLEGSEQTEDELLQENPP